MYVCICGHIPDLSQLFVLPPVSVLLLLLLLSRSVVSLRFVFSMYLALSRLNDASFCHCCCCHCVNIFCPPCFFLLHKSTVSHLPRSHLPLPVYFYIFVVLFFCFQHVELTMYLVVLSIFYILYIYFFNF